MNSFSSRSAARVRCMGPNWPASAASRRCWSRPRQVSSRRSGVPRRAAQRVHADADRIRTGSSVGRLQRRSPAAGSGFDALAGTGGRDPRRAGDRAFDGSPLPGTGVRASDRGSAPVDGRGDGACRRALPRRAPAAVWLRPALQPGRGRQPPCDGHRSPAQSRVRPQPDAGPDAGDALVGAGEPTLVGKGTRPRSMRANASAPATGCWDRRWWSRATARPCSGRDRSWSWTATGTWWFGRTWRGGTAEHAGRHGHG